MADYIRTHRTGAMERRLSLSCRRTWGAINWTILAGMDFNGMYDWSVQELAAKQDDAHLPHAVTKELWLLMVQEVIIPHLQPCDERQLPWSNKILLNGSSIPRYSAEYYLVENH